MSYLTLKANDASIASTFTPGWESIGTGGMQYRAVGATEWTNATAGTTIPVDTTGIELKADTIKTSYSNYFSMTGSISASGDVTSLTNGVGGDCILGNNCYSCMFYQCTALTTAPALSATTLAEYCYSGMFQNCTSLTIAPALPATTLARYCYYCMFKDCTSLTTAPALPATTLASECYHQMFYNCTALTTPPSVLPATTLADYCYEGMFSYCTALTTPPALPATTLAWGCYSDMFYKCTSLTTPPALSATTLAEYCYSGMFQNCTALTTAPALPATTLDRYCYYQMFYNCTSLIGYTTPESGYTLIHNHPSTTVYGWNTDMYKGLNSASTVPETPTSNVNYYFKPATSPSSVEGKVLDCIGHDQHSI